MARYIIQRNVTLAEGYVTNSKEDENIIRAFQSLFYPLGRKRMSVFAFRLSSKRKGEGGIVRIVCTDVT